jgi:hypothetical protein
LVRSFHPLPMDSGLGTHQNSNRVTLSEASCRRRAPSKDSFLSIVLQSARDLLLWFFCSGSLRSLMRPGSRRFSRFWFLEQEG